MLRYLLLLFLMCGVAFAQDDEDDDIEMDETPPAGEEEEKPTKKKPGKATPKRAESYPARAAGKKPGRLKIESNGYRLELPDDWGLKEDGGGKAELAWQVKLPGSEHRAQLLLMRDDNMRDARSTPLAWRESAMKNLEGTDSEILAKPMPQLIIHAQSEGTEARFAYVFKQIKGNSYYFRLFCAAEDFKQAQADLLHAARSFDAPNVELWPAIPKGYVVKKKGPYLVASHPTVKRSLKLMHKVLAAQAKSFKKLHGKLPESDRPVVILVHNSKMQGAKILKQVGDANQDFYVDTRGLRLFVVPIANATGEPAGFLAAAARGLFYMLKYGDLQPAWLWNAEQAIARAETLTGKGLPNLHEGFLNWYGEIELKPVSTLAEEKENRIAFFYACSFHGGKYKKQYKAFLKEYAETHDGNAAFKKHMGSIGDDKLKKAAAAYVQGRIKSIKPKQ